jgi:hypothetical protein
MFPSLDNECAAELSVAHAGTKSEKKPSLDQEKHGQTLVHTPVPLRGGWADSRAHAGTNAESKPSW